MLRFRMYPDRVFMAILTEGMEMVIDRIGQMLAVHRKVRAGGDMLESMLPNAAKVFVPEVALKLLRRMLHCHKGPGLYQMNDYHYLLLYDVLGYFCGVHNSRVDSATSEHEKERLSKVGAFHIQKIRFNSLIDIYFFNTDFLIDNDAAIRPFTDAWKGPGLHDEAFSISEGLPPHPEELKIREVKGEATEMRVTSRYWRPHSTVYPDVEGE